MKRLRQAILWAVLVAIGLLAILSVVGAFLGAEGARELFNSTPVAVYWVALAVLLLAGLVFFKRLLQSPTGLAMHLGSLLVLGGALWGSDGGHELRHAWLGEEKIPTGYMLISEGAAESRVFDDTFRHERVRLPFSLGLREFSIEYYPTGKPWELFLDVPIRDAAGKVVDETQTVLDPATDEETSVPDTTVRVRYLQYLPSAAPVYDPAGKPVLELIPAQGPPVTIPAEVGGEADVGTPPTHVRISRVFVNLKVSAVGDDPVTVDEPGAGWNPALEVEVTPPEGRRRLRYALARMPMHGWKDKAPLNLRYTVPEPTSARADPATGLPAAEVLVRSAAGERRAWMLPHPGDDLVKEPLREADPARAGASLDDWDGPTLFLHKSRGAVMAYKSDIAIIGDDGGKRPLGEAMIEVNSPLHWGGYHFYQLDYDHAAEAFTILKVVSDSGLWAVWAGFFLIIAGVFGKCWGRLVKPSEDSSAGLPR